MSRHFSSLPVVGYNSTSVGDYDTWQFIGASFEKIGGTFIPLSDLTCTEGIADGDQIQMSSVDDSGVVQFKTYEYWDGDGWMDPEQSEYVGDTVGFELGKGAWFFSPAGAKHLTTSGGVKNSSHVHTFTETWSVNVSAYPTDFCPNSENVSWGVADGDQIQTSHVDENGIIQFHTYEYWDGDGWADLETSSPIEADTVVATAGKGFWVILNNSTPATASFTEVSPIAE